MKKINVAAGLLVIMFSFSCNMIERHPRHMHYRNHQHGHAHHRIYTNSKHVPGW